MSRSRLPGVLVIGLSETCHICRDLEDKGMIDLFSALEDDFVTQAVTVKVTGLPPPDTPSILVIDTRYPNFKYFRNVEVFERARTSGKNWQDFLPDVRFFNRKVVGHELEVTRDYTGSFSVDVIKKFCVDSNIMLQSSMHAPARRTAIIKARYT